jgi:hypothetical protein
LATDKTLLALEERQEDNVCLVGGKLRIHPIEKSLGGGAAGPGPVAVDLPIVATQPLQLPLYVPRDRKAIVRSHWSRRDRLGYERFGAVHVLCNNAGVAVGGWHNPAHVGRLQIESPYWPWLRITREVTAVTGACMVVRRSVWDELDGMDPRFPVNYNDIDFCLRAGKLGYRVLIDAQAVLTHEESRTRIPQVRAEEGERNVARRVTHFFGDVRRGVPPRIAEHHGHERQQPARPAPYCGVSGAGPDEAPGRFTHAGERDRTDDGSIRHAATARIASRNELITTGASATALRAVHFA